MNKLRKNNNEKLFLEIKNKLKFQGKLIKEKDNIDIINSYSINFSQSKVFKKVTKTLGNQIIEKNKYKSKKNFKRLIECRKIIRSRTHQNKTENNISSTCTDSNKNRIRINTNNYKQEEEKFIDQKSLMEESTVMKMIKRQKRNLKLDKEINSTKNNIITYLIKEKPMIIKIGRFQKTSLIRNDSYSYNYYKESFYSSNNKTISMDIRQKILTSFNINKYKKLKKISLINIQNIKTNNFFIGQSNLFYS